MLGKHDLATSDDRGSRRRSFGTIEAYRGLAAIAVFCVHGQEIVGERFVPRHGYLAVDLFFILSGVVMAHSYDGRIRDGTMSAAKFMRLRIIRLFPIIIMATLFGSAVHTVIWYVHGPTPFHSLGAIGFSAVLTCFLIPQPWVDALNYYPLDGPFWSLLYEVGANLLFAFAWSRLLGRNLAFIIVLSGIALIALVSIGFDFSRGFFLSAAPLAVARTTYCYFVGVALARLHHSAPRISTTGVVAGVLAGGLLFWASLPSLDAAQDLIADLVLLPILSWLAICVEPGPSFQAIARWLGEASYPVYAFHLPAILAVVGAAKLAGIRWIFPSLISAGIVLVAMVLAGIALHRMVDEPLRRILRRRFERDISNVGR